MSAAWSCPEKYWNSLITGFGSRTTISTAMNWPSSSHEGPGATPSRACTPTRFVNEAEVGGFESLTPVPGALDKLGIEHFVTGPLASASHGVPRATADANIVVDLSIERYEALLDQLGSAFYVPDLFAREAIRVGGEVSATTPGCARGHRSARRPPRPSPPRGVRSGTRGVIPAQGGARFVNSTARMRDQLARQPY